MNPYKIKCTEEKKQGVHEKCSGNGVSEREKRIEKEREREAKSENGNKRNTKEYTYIYAL